MPDRLVIRGALVLREADATPELADVLIDGAHIVSVGRDLASVEAELINGEGELLIPGLINAHTHSHGNLAKGLTGPWPLEEFLNKAPALFGGRTPDDQYLSAQLGAAEMLRAGCTTAYDLFASFPSCNPEDLDAVMQAYSDVGLRVVVAPAFSDLSFYDTVPGLPDRLPSSIKARDRSQARPTTSDIEAFLRSAIRTWHGAASGRLQVGIAPTIPGQCSDELLSTCRSVADEFGVGIHLHLAEAHSQVVHAHTRWGEAIVPHLGRLGILGPRFVGAHGVWLADDELKLLSDTGSNIVHNPASNARLGSGSAPVRDFLAAGITTGLGTDGANTSDNLNMFDALRMAILVSTDRGRSDPQSWLTPAEVLSMALTSGARLLGRSDLGRVSPGHRADLVMIRLSSSAFTPLHDVRRQLVFSEQGADVSRVLVDGRVVFEEGRVQGIDETRLRDRAQERAEELQVTRRMALDQADQVSPLIASARSMLQA